MVNSGWGNGGGSILLVRRINRIIFMAKPVTITTTLDIDIPDENNG